MRNLMLAVFLAGVLSLPNANANLFKLQGLRDAARVGLPQLKEKITTQLQKLPQKALALGTAAIILCTGMIGCNQHRTILDVTDTEYRDPADEAAGQYVTFYIDNVKYEGYWEVTLEGILLIEVDDGYGKIVLLEHLTGTAIPDHSDIGADVVFYGERNGHDVDKYGTIIEVYDNGFYVIDVYEIVYINSGQKIAADERALINIAVLPQDGGMQFLDEIDP